MAVESIPKPSMTPEQVAIVKSTAPILKEHGVAITTHFYAAMLAAHPSLHNIFNRANQATGDQPRALASLVFAFAAHADDLPALEPAIRRVVHRHVSLQVQPAHYPIVGEFLIAAVAHILGPDTVTPAVADAWTAAYAVLADIFVSAEADMYRDNQDRVDPVTAHKIWPTPAGHDGWRPFVIQRRVNESPDGRIVSFYLVPQDALPSSSDEGLGPKQHQPLPTFLPGQYISIRVPVPEHGGGKILQPRQYSLSDAPGKDYYRITVKRDVEQHVVAESQQGHHPQVRPAGLVSNILHDNYKEGDIVEVTYPMGEFYPPSKNDEDVLPNGAEKPMVLISAGVGITPVMSILNTVLAAANGSSSEGGGAKRPSSRRSRSSRKAPITWIHGSHSTTARAFHEHVAEVVSAHPGVVSAHLFLTVPPGDSSNTENGVQGREGEGQGHERQKGGLFLDDPTAEYFVCGPRGFMDAVRDYLVEKNGVDEARVFREVFGTGS
ncbi:uncharacterized protein B0I36DRAFT_251829 [Microdochium trichocladiopsis]|uniref:nitric oxide dioxygenase n=1 Tax=Microdochium trichocladiopsis TaxID=1682393 RepID=A0A9P8XVT2_9PEZI|nr:uncharacterized protein B0I36DRAFT_251829 [Microdochium trichocladiopsis]KAH7021093.1 hypothetical protein B0I36DRAFT_251829 [Microdochium trichocladiopsis]